MAFGRRKNFGYLHRPAAETDKPYRLPRLGSGISVSIMDQFGYVQPCWGAVGQTIICQSGQHFQLHSAQNTDCIGKVTKPMTL